MNRDQWREAARRLSLEEFRVLQHVVGEESQAREAQQLAQLRPGDWVEFDDRDGQTVRGKVHRLNRRTVEVTTDGQGAAGGHHHWRVSVTLVRRVLSGEPPPREPPPLEGDHRLFSPRSRGRCGGRPAPRRLGGALPFIYSRIHQES